MRDLADLSKLARDHYLTQIKDEFGQSGIDAVRVLHPCLRRIFSTVDYESICGSLIVFKLLADEPLPLEIAGATIVEDPEDIAIHNSNNLTIQLLSDGRLAIWRTDLNPCRLPTQSVVYRYKKSDGERFWVNGIEAEVAWQRSYPLFGLPLFRDLQAALQRFGTMVARSSECPELRLAWREPARIMWKAAPESTMRRSLYYYLRATLRDARPDVQQEAPADERNPVDITVRWADSNRIGLIEVKWLGKSGKLNPPSITSEWSESRARDGLQQLVDYLELTKARAPMHDLRGYLVILDGRRARVKAETAECSREDGLAYADRHISFDGELLRRHDVAEPVRCFCEPNWVSGSPSRSARHRPRATSS